MIILPLSPCLLHLWKPTLINISFLCKRTSLLHFSNVFMLPLSHTSEELTIEELLAVKLPGIIFFNCLSLASSFLGNISTMQTLSFLSYNQIGGNLLNNKMGNVSILVGSNWFIIGFIAKIGLDLSNHNPIQPNWILIYLTISRVQIAWSFSKQNSTSFNCL